MHQEYPRLSADSEGVWRQDKPDRRFGINWDEIFGIVGYKLNCITTVDTVLEIEFEYGECIELNSSWDGFPDVVAAITAKIPVLRDGWFEEIETLGPGDEPIVAWRKRT